MAYKVDPATGDYLLDENGDFIEDTVAPAPRTPMTLGEMKQHAITAGYSGLSPEEQALFNEAAPKSKAARVYNMSLAEIQEIADLKAQGYGVRDIAGVRAETGDVGPDAPWWQPYAPTSRTNIDTKAVGEFLDQPDPGVLSDVSAGLADAASFPGRVLKGVAGGIGGAFSGGARRLVENVAKKADPSAGLIPDAFMGGIEGFQRGFSNPTGMLGSPSSAMLFMPAAKGAKLGENILAPTAEAVQGASAFSRPLAYPAAFTQSMLNTPGAILGQGITKLAPGAPMLAKAGEGIATGAVNTMAANAADNMGSDVPLTAGLLPSLAGGAGLGLGGKAVAGLGLHWTPGVRELAEREAAKESSLARRPAARHQAMERIASVVDEANRNSIFPTGGDIAAVGERAGDRAAANYDLIDQAIAPEGSILNRIRGNIELNPKSPNYGHAVPITAPTAEKPVTASAILRQTRREAPLATDPVVLAQSGLMNADAIKRQIDDPATSPAVREELLKLRTLGSDRVQGTENIVWLPPEGVSKEDFARQLEALRAQSVYDPSPMFENARIATRGDKYTDYPAASTRDMFLLAQRKSHQQRARGAHTYSAVPKEVDKALEQKFQSAPTYFAPGPLRKAPEPGAPVLPMLWSDMSALRRPFNLQQGTKLRFGAANMQSDLNKAGGDVISKYMYDQNQSIIDAGLQAESQAARADYARRKLVENLGEEAYKRHVGRIPTAAEVFQENMPMGWRYTAPMLLRKGGTALTGGAGGVLGAGIGRPGSER